MQALGLWLRLWFLEVDGKPVGAKYNFRFAGVEFSYQAGRDPSWDRFSIGLVILAHAMREALADGVQEYRFLRGGEKYKYHLNEDPGLETIPLARRPLGQAALTAHFLLGDRVAFFCPAPAARLVTRFRVGETQDPGERNGTPAGAYG